MRAGPQTRGPALMRGRSGILARNNFAGRGNPTRIFAGQAWGGSMRGGLARFATRTWHRNSFYPSPLNQRLFIFLNHCKQIKTFIALSEQCLRDPNGAYVKILLQKRGNRV